MRPLASGFTLEKLRACLNCIVRVASVSAKRASLAEARLPVGLDLTRPMVVEAFELLSRCCMATPARRPLKLVGHLSFGRPRVAGRGLAHVQKEADPQGTEAQRSSYGECSRGHL